jgi:GNAT superfamily N-acetyltransferase
MNPTFIREATPDDVPGLARVHLESWRTSYGGILPEDAIASRTYELRESQWHSTLAYPEEGVINLVAEDPEAGVVGLASGGPDRGWDPDHTGELYGIYLLRSHQGQGLGRRLNGRGAEGLLQQGHSSMRVWVLEHNPSRRFYEQLGGVYLCEKPYPIEGHTLTQVAYGWSDLISLLNAG